MSGVFYTEYFGISATVAATMMVIVRILDVVLSVFIGTVTDRKTTKYGRFRPWILYGVVPFCVMGVITFYTPDLSESMKIVYAFVTFLIFALLYSVVNIPYSALMGVISEDPKERTSVSAYRNIFMQIGAFIVWTTLFTTVSFFQTTYNTTPQTAFSSVVAVYAVIALIALLCTFFFTRERVVPVKEEKNRLLDDVKDLLSNKPWIMLTIAGIMLLVFVGSHMTMIVYYAKYYIATMSLDEMGEVFFIVHGKFLGFELNWEILSALLLSIDAAVTIVGVILIRPIVDKFGKKETWIACFVFASVVSVLFCFVPKESLGTIVILQTLFVLCIGPSGFIMWSMYADVADHSEVKTGRRATGLIFSSATIAQKLGGTFAATLPLFVLGAIGFVANDINMTDDVRHAILMIFALVPLIGSVIAVIALFFYDIDEKMIQENSAKLAAMKAEKEER
jgi:GPH family glycoside/pentoside/hexuronide:cation symporter